MKTARWLPIGLVTLLAAIGGAGCDRKQESGEQATTQQAAASFSCPMHPEVRDSVASECPKCGMKLTQNAPAQAQASHPHTDHNPKHGGMLGMQGDHHVELVVRHGGHVAVYLYDAYTKPLTGTRMQGNVTLEMPGVDATSSKKVIRLQRGETDDMLVGESPDADRALAANVQLQLPDTTLSMDFPLQSTFAGEIVDVDCFVRLGEKGQGAMHAECARACIEKGLPVGLSAGNTVYLVTLRGEAPNRQANKRLAELAGRHVKLTGRVIEANGVKILELADVEEIKSEPSPADGSR